MMVPTRIRYLDWLDRCQLPSLPPEIWSLIFSYLSIKDLKTIRLVSKLFYSCCTCDNFWFNIIFNVDKWEQSSLSSTNKNYKLWLKQYTLKVIRTSNIKLVTSHSFMKTLKHYNKQLKSIYILPANSTITLVKSTKKRRLTIMMKPESPPINALKFKNVSIENIHHYEKEQLEWMLSKTVKHLKLTYTFSPSEPPMTFLYKLEKLKNLTVIFVHNFSTLVIGQQHHHNFYNFHQSFDAYALMNLNTMFDILQIIFKITRCDNTL
ncbi:unnamed protein product, partial [Didymodactylos carnosus]